MDVLIDLINIIGSKHESILDPETLILDKNLTKSDPEKRLITLGDFFNQIETGKI